MKVAQESTNLKKEADQLLAESGLLEHLKPFGEIVMTGSYAYDLMLAPDIDINIISQEDKKETAQAILNDLINQDWWNGYMFFDWVKFSRPRFPTGFYIGVRTDYEEKRWNVDMWVLSEMPADRAAYSKWVLDTLTPATKQLILEIKAAKVENKWPVDGKTIYDAVLKDGISSVDDFARKCT